MKKNVKYIAIAVVALALIIGVSLKLKSNKKEMDARVYHPDVNVKAVIQAEKVKESEFLEHTKFLGSFAPNHEVTIATEATGKVIGVNVQEGDHVRAGAVLVTLDDGMLQAQLRSAKANLAYAANTLKRYESAQAGVTQLQMDNARTQNVTGQAQIDLLNKQISQYTIKAPFDGIITNKNVELGAVVSPGTPLATLIDISSLKLEINVAEKYISNFKPGETLMVKTDVYPTTDFKGKISVVGSQADASHNYSVKVLVPNNSKTPLKAGMYGTVSIDNLASANGISVPRSALIGSSEKPQVYVIENGVAKLHTIQLGASNETSVQVTGGLKVGEQVAVGGLVNLADGTKVDVK